jgi:hypothetical protein
MLVGNPKRKEHFWCLDIDGMNILKRTLTTSFEDVYWIKQAQDWVHWWVFSDMVLNLSSILNPISGLIVS